MSDLSSIYQPALLHILRFCKEFLGFVGIIVKETYKLKLFLINSMGTKEEWDFF